MAADCLFCKMVSGEIAAPRVAENAQAIAIRDIAPRAPVHVLVIPKAHVPMATVIGAEDGPMLAAMVMLAADVARTEGVFDSGYRLALNAGEDAGTTVFHLHMHLLGGRKLGPEG